MTRTPALLALLLAVFALVGSSCGASGEAISQAENEGQYFTVDGVRYQVQISRQINPSLAEDADYVSGVPEAERELASDEVFFGVFLRAQNTSKDAVQTADEFEIRDTQDKAYEPVEVDNPLGYKSIALAGPNDPDPDPNATANYSPSQGRLILFKLKEASLANRPLELEVKSSAAPDEVGTVDLDV